MEIKNVWYLCFGVIIGVTLWIIFNLINVFFPLNDTLDYINSNGGRSGETIEVNAQEEVLNTALEETNETFYVERNYTDAITQNRNLVNETINQENSATYDLAVAQLALASKQLRTNPEEAIALYGEIYNDSSLNPELRAEALLSVMWHVSSGILLGFETVDFYVSNVYLKDNRFADILDSPLPQNETELRVSTLEGFRKVLELSQDSTRRAKAHGFLAVYLGLSVDPESSKSQVSQKTIDEMRIHIDETIDELRNLSNQAILKDAHNRNILPLFTTTMKVMEDFHRWDAVSIDEVRKISAVILQYYDLLKNQSFSINVFSAGSLFRSMCIELNEANQNIENLDKQYLDKLISVYTSLDDEDYLRQGVIAALADLPQNYCHQSVVSIGQYDSNFQSVLINKVGGWSEEDFLK